METSTTAHFDYVVVGAGTAGCVIANRLSAQSKNQVLLLEAGGRDDYFWIHVPVGYLYTIGNKRTDWCYYTEPDPGINHRSLLYARGKVLGGCSSINAMIYMRGQRQDYDHWAQLGNAGWSWEDVLPVFKRSEDYAHGSDEWHGAGGELRVEEPRVRWEILDAWQDAAVQCGIPKVQEFNRGNNFGSAYFQMNQRRGLRWSATKAFLRPVLDRPNLTVITGAHVKRLAFGKVGQNIQAQAVDAVINNKVEQRFMARKEVILAAGAIGSPQILQLSGVGPAKSLRAMDIPVQHELPGVGENLQDHLQIRMVYKVKNTRTLNRRANSWLGKAAMALEYALFRTGPLTMPPSQVGTFAKSTDKRAMPDMEWHVQPLSLDHFGSPLHSFDAMTPAVCNLRPSSRGSVRLKTPDYRDAPAILLNYLESEADQQAAITGMRWTRRIMAAKAMANFEPHEWAPGLSERTDDELLRSARQLGTTIFHPVGTCKMGRDPMAVVDSQLRVRGIKSLRVADASVMPLITSGNTNAPTVMIAERVCDFIKADAAREEPSGAVPAGR